MAAPFSTSSPYPLGQPELVAVAVDDDKATAPQAGKYDGGVERRRRYLPCALDDGHHSPITLGIPVGEGRQHAQEQHLVGPKGWSCRHIELPTRRNSWGSTSAHEAGVVAVVASGVSGAAVSVASCC
jgi:hypothetical protein